MMHASHDRLRLQLPATLALVWLLTGVLEAPARAQCPSVVYLEDFESGAVGWTPTGDWVIASGGGCGEPCIQGMVGHLEFNAGSCLCDKAPPGNNYCAGELISPWLTLPTLTPGEVLSLDFCADMYMNFGNNGSGDENCHRLLVRSCGGARVTYNLGGAGFWGGPCSPDITTPPIDLSGFQGQCIQMTFIAGDVEVDGGRSRFQVDNVTIVRDDPLPVQYCDSFPNSSGNSAELSSSGCTSVAQNAFELTAHGCPPGQIGLFFFGPDRMQMPFGNGILCVGGPVERLVPASTIDPSGVATKPVDNTAPPAAGKLVPGSTWNFQFWFRDPAGSGATFNLSDGLSAQFVP